MIASTWSRVEPWVLRALALAFVINGVVVAWLAARHLNVVQFDLAGHIASADATWRGQYHQFSDAHFLGYVHGLFYPPLEDVVLGGFVRTLGWPVGYPLYLTLVWAGLLAAGWRLGRRFAGPARIGFLLGFLWLVTAPRDGILYQGLSITDLLTIGLSSQVLAGVWVLGLLDELARPGPRTPWVALWTTLAVGSHIVMGLVAVVLCIGALGAQRRRWRALATVGLWTGGATATFWVPVIAYRGYMTTAHIPPELPVAPLLVAIGLLVVALRSRRARALAAVGAVIVGGLFVVAAWPGAPVPKFHYYRLSLPALLVLLVAAAHLASALGGRRGAALLAAALLLVAHQLPRPRAPALGDYALSATDVDAQPPAWTDELPYGRQWTIESRRAADFGMDSLAEVESGGQARAVKGLYWESSRDNELLSSYLATLVSPPVVLDYLALDGFDCAVQQCLMETFARTFNVRRIAYDRELTASSMSPDRAACLRTIDGNQRFGAVALRRAGAIRDQATSYTVYDLLPQADAANLDTVEPLAVWRLTGVDRDDRHALLTSVMSDGIAACVQTARPTPHVFLAGSELERISRELGDVLDPPPSARASLRRLGPGQFEVRVNAITPVLFWIKLSYFPGMTLRDAAGERLPLYDAFPGSIGYGRGKLTLTYEQPRLVRGAELTTIATLLAALLWLAARVRRRVSARRARGAASAPAARS